MNATSKINVLVESLVLEELLLMDSQTPGADDLRQEETFSTMKWEYN